MCRNQVLIGFMLIAFGFGLLVGHHMESGFWNCVFWVGCIFGGIWLLGHKK